MVQKPSNVEKWLALGLVHSLSFWPLGMLTPLLNAAPYSIDFQNSMIVTFCTLRYFGWSPLIFLVDAAAFQPPQAHYGHFWQFLSKIVWFILAIFGNFCPVYILILPSPLFLFQSLWVLELWILRIRAKSHFSFCLYWPQICSNS